MTEGKPAMTDHARRRTEGTQRRTDAPDGVRGRRTTDRPRVCFVALYHETSEHHPARYLAGVPLYRHLPQALAARGHRVDFVHQFPVDARWAEGGVDYHLVAEPVPVRRLSARAGRLFGRSAARFEPAIRTLRRVRMLHPDVVHVHGADLHLNLALLRALTYGLDARVVLHFHGGFPGRSAAVRALQRFNYAAIDRFLFTTHAHAGPFLEARLIRRAEDVTSLVEVSSPFRMRSREASRRETRMTGSPVFLWTGRLHPVKDPLTALQGFERILEEWPDARLFMYYRTDELLPEVASFLRIRPHVHGRVELRGSVPFEDMEPIYNSADFFLQASRREFSGCAVLEALSCGVLPVVTDLPSFRAMTDDGRHGVLFPVGDGEALARGVLDLRLDAVAGRAAAARSHFDEALSFEAMAARLERVYEEVTAAAPHES